MNTQHKKHPETTPDRVMKYFAIVMALGYTVSGTLLMSLAQGALVIPKVHVLVLSIIFICYGIYRGYRAYLKYFK